MSHEAASRLHMLYVAVLNFNQQAGTQLLLLPQ
jgi:hypothetical protein